MIQVPRWAHVPVTLFLFTASAVIPQKLLEGDSTMPAEQIVDRIQQHEANQSKVLQDYQAIRHYKVEYKGFATVLAAQMEVEIKFDRVTGKSFRIVSRSGSKLLGEKVLERAVASEKEASLDKASTALTPANYQFQLIGTEVVDGHAAYVMHVEPVRPGKFLYRGKIWVNAADFAVERVEAEPAKNPSFWITRTGIVNTNAKTEGVWLPRANRSESKIRVGGTAVLTIDYGTYQIGLAVP
jgi:hypothetical protein